MAKNTPAFQFYPSDFLGGVGMLTNEEVGLYIRLMSALWMSGNLLEFCYVRLSSNSQTTPDVFERIWPRIASKFVLKDGNISHPRFTKMMELSEKRRSSGSAGGFAKSAGASKRPTKTLPNSRRMKNEERSMNNEEEERNFELFWVAFPSGRKSGKKKAREAWDKAIKSCGAGDLIEAASEYASSDVGLGGKDTFVKGPAAWLNGGCWDDDRESWRVQSNGKPPSQSMYKSLDQPNGGGIA